MLVQFGTYKLIDICHYAFTNTQHNTGITAVGKLKILNTRICYQYSGFRIQQKIINYDETIPIT